MSFLLAILTFLLSVAFALVIMGTLFKNQEMEIQCDVGKPTVLADFSGIVKSPKFDKKRYDDNLNCKWINSVPEGKIISMNFLDFRLEDSKNCQNDFVAVYDGSCSTDPLLAMLCGATKIPTIKSSGNQLCTIFHTNGGVSKDGFRIKYENLEKPKVELPVIADATEACGDKKPLVLKISRGFIVSPGFNNDHSHPKQSKCSWTLIASEGQYILIKFSFLRMSPDCKFDTLTLYEGTSVNGKEIRTYCGSYPTLNQLHLKSVGNQIHIWFQSVENSFAGFKLEYTFKEPHERCSSDELQCGDGECVLNNLRCNGFPDCVDGSDETECDLRNSGKDFLCGTTGFPPNLENSLKLGGGETEPGNWPWQVTLQVNNSRHYCSGSLINKEWVLTAAQCFREYQAISDWTGYIGRYATTMRGREATEKKIKIKQIRIHPGWQFTNRLVDRDDIALVQLSKPTKFSTFVFPVCLTYSYDFVKENTKCYAIGWGESLAMGKSELLKHAAAVIWSEHACRSAYPCDLNDKLFCAGHPNGTNHDCQGDIGGPLVCAYQDIWYQVGVASWNGIPCGFPDAPGIYSHVYGYLPWIVPVVKKNKIK